MPIGESSFRDAQAAEFENWRRNCSAAHVHHELREHSEIIGPLMRICGDRDFKHGLEVGIGPYGLGFLAVHFYHRIGAIDGLEPLPRIEIRLEDRELQNTVDQVAARVNYIQGVAESMPFGPDSYDIVSCINVIDHARDPGKIMSEMNRVLAPGGILVFGVSTLSFAGEWKWRFMRMLFPGRWHFVAHPHTFQWGRADALVRTVPGRTLWKEPRTGIDAIAGHGRMSFWIRQKESRPAM